MSAQSGKDTRPLAGLTPISRRLASRRGMILLALVSVASICLAGLGIWIVSSLISGNLASVLEAPNTLDEIADQYPEIAGILRDPQLDSAYKAIFLVYEQEGSEAALELARKYGLVDQNNNLILTLELDTIESQQLIQQLEAGGIQVKAVSGNLVDIAIPLALIEQAMESGDPSSLFTGISELEHIIHIRPPRKGIRQISNSGGESLPAINADEWHAQGFTGRGIKIGVLDLGFDQYQSLLGAELPETVTTHSFIAGVEIDRTGEVHGTAVAEVIYDIAPEAEFFFAAYSTDTEQRLAVDWLVDQGVNIISHSVRSIYGPMDGTGEEARLVERTSLKGVLWVNCAGNDAETHYWGSFSDENGDGYHEFANGDQLMSFNPLGRVRLALNWDAWTTGDQDYDLFILDENKNEIVSSENIQDGPGDDAAEFIEYEFSDGGPYYIAFFARHATRPAILNFFIYDGENLEYTTTEYSITSPADSHSAFTVGATYWSDDSLESYSSRGPTLDGRIKPDITAPTGVVSVTYGEPFFGTSASAPHVSGAAALVWQAHPEFTAQMVIQFLEQRSLDLGSPGKDNSYGFGRLDLGEVKDVQLVPLPTVELSPSPSAVPSPTPLPTGTTPLTPEATITATVPPQPRVNSMGNIWLVLGFLVCVVLPGLAGFLGIGLLGYIFYNNYQFTQLTHEGTSAAGAGQGAAVGYETPRRRRLSQFSGRACPRCGTTNRRKAHFCKYCGLDIRKAQALGAGWSPCLNCGKLLHPTSKYCRHCGSRRQ